MQALQGPPLVQLLAAAGVGSRQRQALPLQGQSNCCVADTERCLSQSFDASTSLHTLG